LTVQKFPYRLFMLLFVILCSVASVPHLFAQSSNERASNERASNERASNERASNERASNERALITFQTVPGNPGSNFGATLVMDGDTVAVGASGEDSATNFDIGAVYLYIRNGFQWELQQSLVDELDVNGLFFGEALALDDDTLAVSSYYRDDSAGAVYIYTRTAGVWTLQAEIVAADRAMNDLFGVALALDGDTLAISAPGADTTAGVDSGAVYIFTRMAGAWTQAAKLLPGTAGMASGRALALSAGTLVVGTPDATINGLPGAGRVSILTGAGAEWTPRIVLTASDPTATARFGLSLSYDSGRIAVGAPGLATGGTSGAVYLFAGSGASWMQQFKLLPNAPQAGQTFGEEVGLNGQRLLIGSPNYDSATLPNSGAAYLFSVIGNNWIQRQVLTGTNASELGYFSAGLALGPEWSAIGSGGETTSVSFYREVSTGQELLVNGSFELGDAANPKIPLGWTQENKSGDKRKCDQSNTRASYEGACTYKFVSRENENSKLTQQVSIAGTIMAGDTLVLDGFVLAKGGDVKSNIKAIVAYANGSKDKAIAKIRQATSGFASLSTFSSTLTVTLTQTPVSITVKIKNRGTSGKILYDGLSLYIPPTSALSVPETSLLPLP
jgi:hypothetical protein